MQGERLAAFRSPHNSPNNIIHLYNVYPDKLVKYFPNIGQNVIVFNAIKTDTQARLSGHDCDSDFVYVTNQQDLADLARKAYTEYTISAISVTDQQAAQEVFQRFTEGEDFQTLFQTYETNPQQKQTGGVVTTYKSRLDSSFDRDFDFEEGEITEPISIEGCYVVIRIDKKSIPDDTALKELMRSEYTSSIKQQAFTDELNQWLADIEIERNEAVWNTIEMIP